MIGWAMMMVQAATPAPATPSAPPAAASARPATGVGLKPGEAMIVRVAPDGTVAVVDGHPGERRPGAGEARIDLRVWPGGSVLTVVNADPRFLLYRAMIVREGRRPERTSICPVLPDGKLGIEQWPYAIGQLVLYGFAYADRPPMVCR